jgi:hypothetical protein
MLEGGLLLLLALYVCNLLVPVWALEDCVFVLICWLRWMDGLKSQFRVGCRCCIIQYYVLIGVC